MLVILFLFPDINECDMGTHRCEHNCVNTEGSYRCTCRRGFTLSSDLYSCNGKRLGDTVFVSFKLF